MSKPERSANFNKIYESVFFETERERFAIDLTYVTSYPNEDTSLYVNISKWWKDTLGDNCWHPTKKHLYIPAVAFNNLIKPDVFGVLVDEFNQEYNGASDDCKPEEKVSGGAGKARQLQQRQQLAGRGRRSGGYNNASTSTTNSSSSNSNASSVAVKRHASAQETTHTKKRRGPPQKKSPGPVKQHRAATPDDCDGSDNGADDDEEHDGGADNDDVMCTEHGNNGVANA